MFSLSSDFLFSKYWCMNAGRLTFEPCSKTRKTCGTRARSRQNSSSCGCGSSRQRSASLSQGPCQAQWGQASPEDSNTCSIKRYRSHSLPAAASSDSESYSEQMAEAKTPCGDAGKPCAGDYGKKASSGGKACAPCVEDLPGLRKRSGSSSIPVYRSSYSRASSRSPSADCKDRSQNCNQCRSASCCRSPSAARSPRQPCSKSKCAQAAACLTKEEVRDNKDLFILVNLAIASIMLGYSLV